LHWTWYVDFLRTLVSFRRCAALLLLFPSTLRLSLVFFPCFPMGAPGLQARSTGLRRQRCKPTSARQSHLPPWPNTTCCRPSLSSSSLVRQATFAPRYGFNTPIRDHAGSRRDLVPITAAPPCKVVEIGSENSSISQFPAKPPTPRSTAGHHFMIPLKTHHDQA
jgi:hypothetical protein